MLFLFGWLRRRRRKALLAQAFPVPWREILGRYPFYAGLTPDDRQRLEDTLRVLVAEMTWEGAGSFEVTDEVRVTIAGLAALLILHIDHDYYAQVTSVIVHPSTHRSVVRHRDGHGVTSEGTPLLGQAWYRGPVTLAWDAVLHGAHNAEDGHNVTLHEFAHRLDMLDGFVDGTPPLHHRSHYAAWQRVMTEEFARLKSEGGRARVLDSYGAVNEGEFFAVVTEAFFEKPRQMLKRHPELYALLRDYYRQDPVTRLT